MPNPTQKDKQLVKGSPNPAHSGDSYAFEACAMCEMQCYSEL